MPDPLLPFIETATMSTVVEDTITLMHLYYATFPAEKPGAPQFEPSFDRRMHRAFTWALEMGLVSPLIGRRMLEEFALDA